MKCENCGYETRVQRCCMNCGVIMPVVKESLPIRIGAIVMNQNNIKTFRGFWNMEAVHAWIKRDFPTATLLRYTRQEMVYKTGRTPDNIVVAPLSYTL